ncbi:pectinesterase [Chitinophaga polysaccharea]|uniref:Pectinesterase n=1 Tax=Chitinophaga polysaccharea TaxID=1293035 RepID=A0A561PNX6_9BACT|nr:pectinesterase family protein [Chitinophaga polysaccharea]TWF39812.1 pectinesterase [Chitinophaga polysaccharea]
MKQTMLLLTAFLFVGTSLPAQVVRKTVAQDGSGDYTTVQAALDAIPLHNTVPVHIYIRKGIYKEKLHLDSTKDFVTLTGEDAQNTILTYDDHAGMHSPTGDTITTYSSPSCIIHGNNFRAEELTFANTAGISAGQAVALSVKGDRATFIHCRMLGFQDTLLAGTFYVKQYYEDCYIEGSTDFIFGYAAAFFNRCQINSKSNSYITAAATPPAYPVGYVFKDCKLTADSGVTRVYLGRPWRPYASVTWLHCEMRAHILPAGWDNWRKTANEQTARYAEYKSKGPGANNKGRASWARQLTKKEARQFSPAKIFGDWKF